MKIEKKKKNKKGQIGFGAILIAFIGVIVGITLFTVVAQTVGTSTSTVDVANQSISSVNGTTLAASLNLNGSAISNVVVYNATTSATMTVSSGNYTVYNHQVKNGAQTVVFNVSADAIYQGENWKISYTYEPTDYVGGAGRSMALLIPIFFALLIAVIALEPTLRSNVLEAFGR